MRSDLERISEETQNALDSIICQIDGVEISRLSLVDAVKHALGLRRFVNIIGLPGTGKSAVLHACVQDTTQNGTVLFLKSDRLTGPNWAAHARSLGLTAPTIEALLSEISTTGSSILFIDGIDRVERRAFRQFPVRIVCHLDAPRAFRIAAQRGRLAMDCCFLQ